jgi:fructose/tagatose bisphosphate aldolase
VLAQLGEEVTLCGPAGGGNGPTSDLVHDAAADGFAVVAFHGGLVGPLVRAATVLARAGKYGVGLHLDHVTDMNLLRQAADAGFSSAMFDAHRQLPEGAMTVATSRQL